MAGIASRPDSRATRCRLAGLQWLSARLAHSDLSSLLADCRRAQDGVPNQQCSFAGLRDALELSAHVLLQAPEQLAAQLYGRLRSGQSPEIDALIEQAETHSATQSLRPLTQSLRPTGFPLKRTLWGHEDGISGALELADGRLLSWSGDKTLRLWAADGHALGVLTGHEGRGHRRSGTGRWPTAVLVRGWDAAAVGGGRHYVGGTHGARSRVYGAGLALTDGRLLSWS